MPTATLEYGTPPSYDLVNETGLLIRRVTLTPERTTRRRQGQNRATVYLAYDDPTLGIELEGTIIPATVGGAAEGLAQAHPGSAIELANCADNDAIHGFTIDEANLTVIESASRQLDETEAPSVTVGARYFPFVLAPV